MSTDADLPPTYTRYPEELQLLRLDQDQSPPQETSPTIIRDQVTSHAPSSSLPPTTGQHLITTSPQHDRPSALRKPKRSPSAKSRKRFRRKLMKQNQERSQADQAAVESLLSRGESPTPHSTRAEAAAMPSDDGRPPPRDPRLANIAGARAPTASQASRENSSSIALPSSVPIRPSGSAANMPLVNPYVPAPGQPGYARPSPTSPLSGRPSGTPQATPPHCPRPSQPTPRAGEIPSDTAASSSPPSPQQSTSQTTSSPAQATKRPRSDGAGLQESPATAPPHRHYPAIAEDLIDARTTAVPPSPNFPWIRDAGLIDLASKGLLMPLELIRLLSLSTIHERGIPPSLWQATPAHTCSIDARRDRQQTFASAFADRDTLLEAWQNYMTIAIEVHQLPADRISGYFNHRWTQIETYGRTYGWLQTVQLLHDRLELSVAEGLRIDHWNWLDLDRAPRPETWQASTEVSKAGLGTG